MKRGFLRVAVLAIVQLVAPVASAQEPRAVVVDAAECPPAWYDASAFTAALRVELAARGVDVGLGDGDRAGIRLRVLACGEGDALRIVVGEDAYAVSLLDLAPDARLRTLAMVTADRVLVALDRAPSEPAPSMPEPQADREPDAVASSRAAGLAPPRATRSAALSDASPPEVAARGRELRLGLGGLVAIGSTTGDVLGGARAVVELAFGELLFVRAGALVLYGAGAHPLGRVAALAAGGLAGLGVDVRMDVFRIAPRLELAAAYVELRATPSDASVHARDEQRELVWLEPAVHVGVDVDRFWIGLDVGAPIPLRPIDARAVATDVDGSVFATGPLMVRLELVLGVAIDLGA